MRSPSGRYWDWAQIVAQCRARPGSWVVRLPNEPARLVRTIRDRSAPELHLDDGVIEVVIQNEYRDEWGGRRGDLYLRFAPRDTMSGEGTTPERDTP
jgi:hypothetical protein